MKIVIQTVPSEESNTKTVTLEDLCLSKEEWEALDEDGKEEKLNDYLSELSDQPYWMVDKFKERD